MNNNFTIGRINFGPREAFTTLGQLIDDISSQEELIEELCLLAGNMLTEKLWLEEHLPTQIYEL